MYKKIIFIILYFISPIVPILTIYYSNTYKYNQSIFAYPMILGAAAYTWLVAEFILISRPKFIEKYFGMDKFYRFHGWMAIISIGLVLLHKFTILGYGRLARAYGDGALNLFAAVAVISLVLMVDSVILKIKPILWIRKLVEKVRIFKYEHYVAFHNLSAIALILMLIHVLLTSAARENLPVRLVYILYFTLGVGFYLYHRVFKIFILKKHRFLVKEVIKESANMCTLRFVPEKEQVFQYQPGQFGFFRIMGKHVTYDEHPFSISSTPSNKEFLSVTIKALGDYTSNVINVEPGDKVYIDGPFGKFSYTRYPDEKSTVLIAGGVGITPVLSMLRFMHSQEKDRKVILLWGVNSRTELICRNEIERMRKEMRNFVFIPVMSMDASWEGEKGYIDEDKINKILLEYGYNISSAGFYICGPAIMMSSVIQGLKALGVKRKRIHFEKFSM